MFIPSIFHLCLPPYSGAKKCKFFCSSRHVLTWLLMVSGATAEETGEKNAQDGNTNKGLNVQFSDIHSCPSSHRQLVWNTRDSFLCKYASVILQWRLLLSRQILSQFPYLSQSWWAHCAGWRWCHRSGCHGWWEDHKSGDSWRENNTCSQTHRCWVSTWRRTNLRADRMCVHHLFQACGTTDRIRVWFENGAPTQQRANNINCDLLCEVSVIPADLPPESLKSNDYDTRRRPLPSHS